MHDTSVVVSRARHAHEHDLPLRFRKGARPPGCRWAKSVTSYTISSITIPDASWLGPAELVKGAAAYMKETRHGHLLVGHLRVG